MSAKQWAWYFGGMFFVVAVFAVIAFYCCVLLGVSSHNTLILTTQGPIIGVLLIWVLALLLGGSRSVN